MPLQNRPRHLPGTIPGKDFVSEGGDPFGLKVGMITRVDEVNMKADIRVITGGGERFEIDLTQAMAGPRSFWGGVPEVNSVVLIGYRRIHKQLYDAVILGYVPVGNRSGTRFDPIAPDNPTNVAPEDAELFDQLFGKTVRHKRLTLRPGDVGGMSSAGAEFVLSKDVVFTNRAGDTLELRDSDRTWIAQSIHRVETESGVKRISGPVRRGGFFLPPDILDEAGLLRSDYLGKDELQAAGPGHPGSATKWADADGKLLEIFNNENDFPPVTLASGRRVFYVSTRPATSVEDPDDSADAFVENRMELYHTSSLTHEVTEEIDGFSADRRTPFIERVYGTVVGNDLNSSQGLRQYGHVLKPKIFPDFQSRRPGKFTLEEVDRQVTAPDTEVLTTAGAFLFRVRPPRSVGDNAFVAAVSKQGKLFLNVPASGVEDYPSGTKRISAEVNLEGALKAFIGASAPDRISAHLTLEGGLHLDIGRDAQGNAITTTFHSGTKTVYEGNPNADDVTCGIEVRGVKESSITGAEVKTIEGSKKTLVNGMYSVRSDRFSINAFQGYSGNYGEYNLLVSGKTQENYALAVLETIVAGGKITTVLAGGLISNVAAGAVTHTAGAGAMAFNVPGGAYSVTVGTGAIAITTSAGAVSLTTGAGAMAISAGGGAIAITAGLALNLTASAAVSIVGAQVLLGGPPAVLGVCRGTPSLPPGVPTLDPFTGLPLFGSALIRSI